MSRILALVSGGVDSAVASALALEQGVELVMLHFETKPLGNTRGEEKTVKLAGLLGKKFGKKIKVCVVQHGPTLFAIAKNCDRKFGCVVCRRTMLRVASKIAKQEKCTALLTGESLGQVASQTLHNLNAEHGASELLVVKPLLGMDKLEIEKLAKAMGTFETSILPSACCSIPVKPSTKATAARVEMEEKRLDLENVVEKCVKSKKCKTFG